MAQWLYSSEALPNPDLIGKPGYTPEIPMFNGISIIIPAKEWTRLPEHWPMYHHRDWMDKHPRTERVYADDVVKGLKYLQVRGVIFLDHEPTHTERAELPKLSEDLNLKFRMEQIKLYEDQVREKEVTGHGRTKPTPYEDECYTLLGISKPYSPEALRSSRQPGIEAAERIATAIADALARDRESTLKLKVPAQPK
jgi:hypothetical protein